MPDLSVTVLEPGGPTQRIVEEGAKAWQLFSDDRSVIAATVGGELSDLAVELHEGDVVGPVAIGSEEGRAILRHSTAHVLAQAVQDLYPDARLGIGPPVRDGFYYDFDVKEPFKPEDVERIETRMRKIVKEGQRFSRRVVTDGEAREELADEPYKLELIELKGGGAGDAEPAEGASVEVGAGDLTIYDNLRRDGSLAWKDLCRGPHLPTTKRIPAFRLMRTAAAYWRGDEQNPQLQRIYGTAWESTEALEEHVHRLEEAQRRDHRRLGAELDLFSFPDEIGSGLAVFHPKGGALRKEMEDYSRRRHVEAGYEFVYSPHITKSDLFETSGHLQWFADGMYPPMKVDESRDADGAVLKPGSDYYLKPMNCPFHCLIFRSRGRSYRELPLRMFEFGSVYRYEKSGVIHGLTRVRGMTQDDAHIYATRDQLHTELTSVLTFVLDLLKDYGLNDFYLELSTKDPDKYVGEDAIWAEATATLETVAKDSGLELVPDPGGAAFYGPKISVQARDAIGRTWQMSTIQLDFNLPERFKLEYAAADGSRQRPVMIHRALFGSIERFLGVLTEHYAGAFPPWLAPVQAVAIPIAERHLEHLQAVADELGAHGVRVEVDGSDDRMQKKIRTAQTQKVPFMLLAGDRDVEQGAVSFRYRSGEQDNGVPVEEAVRRIRAAISTRAQV
ncbi:MAG: Threonyl-tRNA synthetase [uncultured Nocardioidaceae bacterium]|uniref:Threonine--tRNA ligase n=1 Tax=uncultured Nocardioidaceae bacterium TaxID=253824 RepID=A0A6J4M938_9ACTN|nr:MAG: Threonyl-tRNA synthetase [uncultured Nocardioidaceae bacterium]